MGGGKKEGEREKRERRERENEHTFSCLSLPSTSVPCLFVSFIRSGLSTPFGLYCVCRRSGLNFFPAEQRTELQDHSGLQPGSVRLRFIIRLISLVATFQRTLKMQIFNLGKGTFAVIIPQFGIVLPNGMPDILSIEIHTHKESLSELTGCQVHLANNLCFTCLRQCGGGS